jgi:hypothetical protein
VAGLVAGLDVGALGRVIGALGLVLGVEGLGFTDGLVAGLAPLPEGIDGLVAGRLILLLEFVGRVVGLVVGRAVGRFVDGLTDGEVGFLYVLPS